MTNAPSGPSIEFGLFDQSGNFKPAESVPNVVGQSYGWRARIDGAGEVNWREEFTLPKAPDVWGEGEVSGDGRTSVTEGTALPKDGYIHHLWTVAVGDPNGDHVMTVWLNGKKAATFNFKVLIKDPSNPPPPH